jgi:aerobic C4-dicarboxylate transport protein
MSEARAITNTIGNAVGTVVIGRWVGAVDRDRMRRILDGEQVEHAPVAESDAVAVPLMNHQKASA